MKIDNNMFQVSSISEQCEQKIHYQQSCQHFQLRYLIQALIKQQKITLIQINQKQAHLQYCFSTATKRNVNFQLLLLRKQASLQLKSELKFQKESLNNQHSIITKIIKKLNTKFQTVRCCFNSLKNTIQIFASVNLGPMLAFPQIHQWTLKSLQIFSMAYSSAIFYIMDMKSQRFINIQLLKLRNQFEQARISRDKPTMISLLSEQNKIINFYLQRRDLTRRLNKQFNDVKQRKALNPITPVTKYRVDKNNLKEVNPFDSGQQQMDEKGREFLTKGLLKGILIKQQRSLETIQTGGNGIITKYKCQFQELMTVSPQSQRFIELSQKNGNDKSMSMTRLIQDILVKKQPLPTKNSIESFKAELVCVYTLKQISCPQIAQYYKVSQLPEGDFVKQEISYVDSEYMYLKYYEYELNEYFQKKSTVDRLKIFKDLMKGIYTLSSNGVLHRDIKPSNVRLDKKFKVKIIDFGSAGFSTACPNRECQLMRRLKFNFTSKYSLEFSRPQLHITRSSMTSQEFYSHPFYDMYAYGITLELFFGQCLGDCSFVLEHVKYLWGKCMEYNPEDRLSPEQVLQYIDVLLRFFS